MTADRPCPICAHSAAIWAHATATADQPGTWTATDDAMDDHAGDNWASDADMDDAADRHYRNETTPCWRDR